MVNSPVETRKNHFAIINIQSTYTGTTVEAPASKLIYLMPNKLKTAG